MLVFMLVGNPVLAEDSAGSLTFANVSYQETAAWKADTAPDARFVYGSDSAPQHADLRLPKTAMPSNGYPVLIFVHGGAWRSEWSKNYTEAFVEALTGQGFATWDLEYRRLGHRGGGYPGTFEDIADGADYLRVVAESYPLDLDRVIAVGHSSGGHLALWLAGRKHLAESSALFRAAPLVLQGVVSIAGVNDLEMSYTLGDRKDVLTLLGVDSLKDGAQRFKETNPARLLPFGVPQTLMIGDQDAPWRLTMTQRYAESTRAAGDATKVVIVAGANHMDVMDARSGFAASVARQAREILKR
jgi:acetyl esterase/lipase